MPQWSAPIYLWLAGTSSSGDGEVLGAEDGGSDDALTGEVEGTWRLAADSEDISLGRIRVLW